MLERKLSLENVAFAQSPFAFKVERGDNLPVQDDVFDIRCILGDGVDDGVAESFFLVVPVEAGAQLVGRVLHEAGEHVFARRRDGGIGERGNDHVDVGLPREVAVLGVVVGALHVFDGRRDRDCSAQVRAGAGDGFEVRQSVQRHVHFAGRAAIFEAVDVFEKIGGQVLGFDESD